MTRTVLSFWAFLLMTPLPVYCADEGDKPPGLLPRSRSEWQEFVDRETFAFEEKEANIRFSISQYAGEWTVKLTRDEKRRWQLQLTFQREQRSVLTLPVNEMAVFVVHGDSLYLAVVNPFSPSGYVFAYRLTDGKEMWRTRLQGTGAHRHSAYSSAVNISTQGDAVVVFGREIMGDYIEVLDGKTGERLAHKLFPRESAKVEPPGPFPDDPRLDAKVTYQYATPTPMLQFFRDLSKQTGTPLTVPPEFENGRLTCVKHTESLRTAMRHWTEDIKGKWVRDGDGYRFVLADLTAPSEPLGRAREK